MSFSKIVGCICAVLALPACQNLNGFTRQQVQVLKAQGFTPDQDNWYLGLSEKLLFNVNESVIKSETYQKIVDIGQQLHQVQIRHLQLNGYTDNSGAASYNQALSLKRAQAVAEPLITGGIAAQDINSSGLGEQNPIADNTTEQGRGENRRVAIIVKP